MILFIRILFILGCSLFGFFTEIPWLAAWNLPQSHLLGAGVGFLIGTLVITIDIFFKQYTVRNILAVLIGFALGLGVHKLFMMVMNYAAFPPETMQQFGVASAIIFSYLGVITILRGQDEFTMMIPFVTLDTKGNTEELILVDTSVIIDGRIADICKTNFMSGKFILPRFVLKELQLIADSSDPLKRNRGRRGLDVLNKLKRARNISIRIHEEDFPDIPAVDEKLIKLSRLLGGKVLTNDFNLNKLAELQGVSVLNLNELSNALKPMFLPGENLETRLVKEGKEPDQAIGYLEDGTMIVVDHAKRHLGQTVRLVVTSVLQTAAGRMIFARLDTENPIIGLEDA